MKSPKSFIFAVVIIISFTGFSQAWGQGLWLGEDIEIMNSSPIDYETQSVCGSLADLAKKARLSKPQGDWKADFVAVDKKRRLLHLMQEGRLFRSYHVALGKQPIGKKTQEGDNKTPEGLYMIDYRNSASSFHLSLHISYPNQEDINQARRRGVSPGGDIFIHGLPNEAWKRWFINHPKKNWTRGCVAVTNEEIEEIWGFVNKNTPIELCP